MIDEVMSKADQFDMIEDAVIEACATYEDYGNLIAELLGWNCGRGNFDDMAAKLATDLMREYINETV